jgi:hypothetical protein
LDVVRTKLVSGEDTEGDERKLKGYMIASGIAEEAVGRNRLRHHPVVNARDGRPASRDPYRPALLRFRKARQFSTIESPATTTTTHQYTAFSPAALAAT